MKLHKIDKNMATENNLSEEKIGNQVQKEVKRRNTSDNLKIYKIINSKNKPACLNNWVNVLNNGWLYITLYWISILNI